MTSPDDGGGGAGAGGASGSVHLSIPPELRYLTTLRLLVAGALADTVDAGLLGGIKLAVEDVARALIGLEPGGPLRTVVRDHPGVEVRVEISAALPPADGAREGQLAEVERALDVVASHHAWTEVGDAVAFQLTFRRAR
jgi:hypothetical protein